MIEYRLVLSTQKYNFVSQEDVIKGNFSKRVKSVYNTQCDFKKYFVKERYYKRCNKQ